MKIDIVQRKARRKDFLDLDELLDKYSIDQLIALQKQRYPHGHDEKVISENIVDFERADEDFTRLFEGEALGIDQVGFSGEGLRT